MRKLSSKLRRIWASFKPGTRSLKSTLTVYYLPLAVIPAVFASFYATRAFDENTRENLVRRALSERDAIASEIDSVEEGLLSSAKLQSQSLSVRRAAASGDRAAVRDALATPRRGVRVRVYGSDGRYLGGRVPQEDKQIPYLSAEGFRRVKNRGETIERYYATDGSGFVTVARSLLRDSSRFYGVLEMEYRLGQNDLREIKNRRQIDLVFLNRDLKPVAASFVLQPSDKKMISETPFMPGSTSPVFLTFGENRYAAFLFDLPAPAARDTKWGYYALFLPLAYADANIKELRSTMITVTAILVLAAVVLIFVLSRRIVAPVELLVRAMRRVKTGRIEQIPQIDTTFEIEYLIHSFNEMTRNVASAKDALEEKVTELRAANDEIRNAQATLVQSAKMISLGQIVAGVAHELNNPIAFIYSNMHHLSEYVEKIRDLVAVYRKVRESLPKEIRDALDAEEARVEIDFLLKDMEDLTRSCVDGANRVKEIVTGLRTFSRMDDMEFRRHDLREGLHSTIRLLVTEFKERVRVHEEFEEIPSIDCNLSQLNQVFMNLLSNAAQAISGKGEVWVRTRRAGEFVEVEIEDTGGGMPKEVLEKIFDPFFTTKAVGEGTGLGLSIAYGLIQKHQGSIRVSSAVGQGTKFTIRLPIRQHARQIA